MLLAYLLVSCQAFHVIREEVNDDESEVGGTIWRNAIKAEITALKEELRVCQTSMCRQTVMYDLKRAIEKRMNNLRIGIRAYSQNMIACDDDACRDSWNLKISVLQKILNRHKMFLRDNTKGGN